MTSALRGLWVGLAIWPPMRRLPRPPGGARRRSWSHGARLPCVARRSLFAEVERAAVAANRPGRSAVRRAAARDMTPSTTCVARGHWPRAPSLGHRRRAACSHCGRSAARIARWAGLRSPCRAAAAFGRAPRDAEPPAAACQRSGVSMHHLALALWRAQCLVRPSLTTPQRPPPSLRCGAAYGLEGRRRWRRGSCAGGASATPPRFLRAWRGHVLLGPLGYTTRLCIRCGMAGRGRRRTDTPCRPQGL